jgi:hypothetical protein
MTPDFDDLVGLDLDPRERQRLRQTHELLLEAGPPPELSPEIERGPNMLATYQRRKDAGRKRPVHRRSLLLAAAAVALLAIFFGGYATGHGGKSPQAFPATELVAMHGTAAAPNAQAAIRVGEVDNSGNWPMRFVASGLPALGHGQYYELFLTRHGKVVGPCGTFRSSKGGVVTYLNAPYRLRNAGWIVTRQGSSDTTRGPVVLTTA